MTFAEYQKIDAVNWSRLKAGRTSALHLKHRMEEPPEDTTAMALGRAAHAAVFEPRVFATQYVCFPGERRAGKAWDLFCEEHPEQTILKADEFVAAIHIAAAVRGHPVAGPLLEPPGEAEKVITWTDEATGLACKGRLDWYRAELLCDLKTTQRIGPRDFAATMARMGYHGQMAWYRAGLVANGLPAPVPRLIAVEAGPPHDVAVYRLSDDALFAGEQDCAELLRMLAAGRFSGQWPGQALEEQEIELPAWAWRQEDSPDPLLAALNEATNVEG